MAAKTQGLQRRQPAGDCAGLKPVPQRLAPGQRGWLARSGAELLTRQGFAERSACTGAVRRSIGPGTAVVWALAGNSGGAKICYQSLQNALKQHCYVCHSAVVQAKVLCLDGPQYVKQNAAGIYRQTVVSQQMPVANSTCITAVARQLIASWLKAGAPINA